MSKVRWALAGALGVLSIWAAVHGLTAYVVQGSTLGAAVVIALMAILIVGFGSLGLARRRAGRELQGLSMRAGDVYGARRARLEKLARAGVKPDTAALARVAAADESQRAVLGRYLVATTVLFGLVGTFAGLMETVGKVAPLLANGQAGAPELALAPLAGLDITFGASLVAILVTLALTLVQGDLALAEESLLATLEELTAHELVPTIWPAGESAAERTVKEVAALRTELAAGLGSGVGDVLAQRLDKALADVGQRVGDSTKAALGNVADVLGERVTSSLTKTQTQVATSLTKAQEQVATSLTSSQAQVAQAVERLGVAAEGAAARMSNAAEGAAARMGTAAEGAAERQATAVQAELTRLVDRLEAAASGMRGDVTHATEALTDVLKRTSELSTEESRRMIASIEESLTKTHQRVGDATLVLTEAVGGAARETQGELKAATAALQAAAQASRADAEALAQAVAGAIETAVAESSTQAGQRIGAVAAALEDKLGPVVLEQAAKLAALSDAAIKAAAQVQETLGAGTEKAVAAMTAMVERADQSMHAVVERADAAIHRTEAALAELATVQATAVRETTAEFARSLIAAVEAQGGAVTGATTTLTDVAGRLRELLETVGPALVGLTPELGGVARQLAELAARAEAAEQPAIVLEELVRLGEGVERMEGLLRLTEDRSS